MMSWCTRLQELNEKFLMNSDGDQQAHDYREDETKKSPSSKGIRYSVTVLHHQVEI